MLTMIPLYVRWWCCAWREQLYYSDWTNLQQYFFRYYTRIFSIKTWLRCLNSYPRPPWWQKSERWIQVQNSLITTEFSQKFIPVRWNNASLYARSFTPSLDRGKYWINARKAVPFTASNINLLTCTLKIRVNTIPLACKSIFLNNLTYFENIPSDAKIANVCSTVAILCSKSII